MGTLQKNNDIPQSAKTAQMYWSLYVLKFIFMCWYKQIQFNSHRIMKYFLILEVRVLNKIRMYKNI